MNSPLWQDAVGDGEKGFAMRPPERARARLAWGHSSHLRHGIRRQNISRQIADFQKVDFPEMAWQSMTKDVL